MSAVLTPRALHEMRRAAWSRFMRTAREATLNATTGATLSRAEVAAQIGASESLQAQREDETKDANFPACDVEALPLSMRLAVIARMLPEGYAITQVGSAETQVPRLSELLAGHAAQLQELLAACADGVVTRGEAKSLRATACAVIEHGRTIVAVCDEALRTGSAKASVLS